jgi:hypothetical protein
VDLALVLDLLELPGRFARELWQQVLRVDLMQASIKAKRTLLERPHLLEAQRHVVHRHLDQKAVFRVLLELKPIEEGLGLLEKTQ